MKHVRLYIIPAIIIILASAFIGGCTRRPSASNTASTTQSTAIQPGKRVHRIVFVMKLIGIPYTNACEEGMQKAAKDLGIEAEFLGPSTGGDSMKQISIIEDQISRGVDAIVISPNDDKAVIPVIKKAMSKGIKIFTWDSDAPQSQRIFYVAAADDIGIGVDVINKVAKDIGGKGKVAVMTGSANALNLKLHVQGIEQGAKKYPGITLVKPYIYNDDDQQKAITGAITLLQANPDLAAFACANSPGVPGVARALIQTGKDKKVKVWGLSTPKDNRDYIKQGIVNGLTLWDPGKLTYVTTKLVNDYINGKKPHDGMEIPGVGKLKVKPNGVIIMPGVIITKENVDQFNF